MWLFYFGLFAGKNGHAYKAEEFLENPAHPYTQMLLSSNSLISEEEESMKPERVHSEGEIPSLVNIPSGCSFCARCSHVIDI